MTVPERRHVIVVREYDTVVIGDEWDPSRGTIPMRAVAEIERLQAANRHEIFRIGRRSLTAQNFVGTVGVDGHAIDILPKTDTGLAETRANLMRMLSVAGLVPAVDAGVASLAARAPTMVDAFMHTYVTQLALEWRRGRIASYRKHEANRTALRGKLLFDEQLRVNRVHPELFFTRADEFLQDGPITRLLKTALRLCGRHASRQALRQEARSLTAEFGEIPDQDHITPELLNARVDRRSERFAPLVELAKLLLTGHVPDRSGPSATYSLVFDMNVVFERFISQMLSSVTASSFPTRRVRAQVDGRSLLLQTGRPRFGLRPDLEIMVGQERICLLDTKWKRLEPHRSHKGVSQADMYQMYAYGKEYGCPLVAVLYPRHSDLARRVASYVHHPGDATSPRIEVCTVDVSESTHRGENSVFAQLRALVHDLIEPVGASAEATI